jgi:SAM-dependent methyltransferase/uncharacterized protein YbaR (Trm112 family)
LTDWVYPLLRCPLCGGNVKFRALDDSSAEGLLEHDRAGCEELYPVIGGIPRMLVGAARAELVRTRRDWFAANGETRRLAEWWEAKTVANPVIAGFDDEWHRFRDVGTADQSQIFDLYFDLVPASCFASELIVLDAGSGAGRWAYQVAQRGPRVIAIDVGRSVEVARANTPPDRVACIQADVSALPFAPGAVDWAYSLGVLHHTESPERGLANIVSAVRPGGIVLLYLYYALDRRGLAFRALYHLVDLVRRVLSRQPRAVTRAVATVVATSVYWPLARSAALLERVGAGSLAARLPLSFYRHLSFATMQNDSLDRFGTRLERRYSQAQMITLMRRAGLVDPIISASPPWWHGTARKAKPH